jgi:hypothetical protein
MQFKDITETDEGIRHPRELPPASILRRPYWLMRVLRRIILTGGYLTPKIYVPQIVWNQCGVKFSGLSTKTTAFEQIIVAVTSRVFPVDLPSDILSTNLALSALKMLVSDLINLQNNLSKPFPFIREINTKSLETTPTPNSNVYTIKIAIICLIDIL